MKKRKNLLLKNQALNILRLLLSIAIVFSFTQCKEPKKPTNKKVIISSGEEVNELTGLPGESVTFRIYYANTTSNTATLEIIDTISTSLKNISLKNGGVFKTVTGATFRQPKIATWKIKDVAAGKGGYVEFTADISSSISPGKKIKNRAHIVFHKPGGTISKLPDPTNRDITLEKLPKQNMVTTNTVVISICGNPQLGWVPFKPQAKKSDKPFYALKDETTMGIMVNFEFPGMFVQERVLEGDLYHAINIPTLSSVNELGFPAVPVAGKIIEIPKDVNFEIEIFKADSHKFSCYNVMPYQELTTEQYNDTNYVFTIDSKTYAKNAFYPGKLAGVEVQDMGIVRGHRLLFLKAYPVQFNPIKKSITAFSQIEVRVKYDKPGQIEPISSRLYSPAFEEILEAAVYNYKFDRPFNDTEGGGGTGAGGTGGTGGTPPTEGDNNDDKRYGCDYLIITEDGFYDPNDDNNPITRLVNWKTRKGLVVDVERIGSIGNTSANIISFLDNAYRNWTRVPAYVVLIGDANHITPDYRTNHSSHEVNVGGTDVATPVGTDLYYSTLDGSDYFPDIILSRISVDNIADLNAVIDKTLRYEQNPPALNDYYENTSLVRLFEDDDPSDDREDNGWYLIEYAEEMLEFLDDEGYTTERIYNFSGGIAGGPQRWEDGTNLPDHLTQQAPSPFPWSGGAADIDNAFDDGRFLVTYRGHGGRNGWSRPRFRIGNIPNLASNNMPSFVFGLTCMTGWFDDETDHAGLGTTTDCFAEEMLRANGRGAIGIVASARNSWGSCNNPTTEGMCDALWPDFDNTIHGGYLPGMGQILIYSKTYLAQQVGATNSRLITFEMTHLFGEPELPVWINRPGNLKVTHPDGVGSQGLQDLIVKVVDDATNSPVANAKVVLTRGLTILAGVQTDPDGNARITLNNIGSGEIDVTVTSKFYRPYMGTMASKAGGAYINVLDPENGISNQEINLGGKGFDGNEQVKIYFDGALVKTINAASGSFGQSNDVTFNVPNGKPLGLYNVVAVGSTSGRHAVDVFQVRNQRIVDLYTYSQWDPATWYLDASGGKVWNSPEIWLQSGGSTVASNNLVVGTNYEVNARVYNSQNNDANNVKVTFKWALHGAGQVDWHEFATKTIDVPANGSEIAKVNWAPASTGHVCVKAEIYHIEDIDTKNNKGQENCHVGTASSPSEVEFTLCNPTDKPGMVYIEIYQHRDKDQEGRRTPLWGSFVKHPDPQLLKPGECTTAKIIVDPDFAKDKVYKGDVAKFTVSAYIDRELIGGIDLEITKQ